MSVLHEDCCLVRVYGGGEGKSSSTALPVPYCLTYALLPYLCSTTLAALHCPTYPLPFYTPLPYIFSAVLQLPLLPTLHYHTCASLPYLCNTELHCPTRAPTAPTVLHCPPHAPTPYTCAIVLPLFHFPTPSLNSTTYAPLLCFTSLPMLTVPHCPTVLHSALLALLCLTCASVSYLCSPTLPMLRCISCFSLFNPCSTVPPTLHNSFGAILSFPSYSNSPSYAPLAYSYSTALPVPQNLTHALTAIHVWHFTKQALFTALPSSMICPMVHYASHAPTAHCAPLPSMPHNPTRSPPQRQCYTIRDCYTGSTLP
jgi:hypothetical protein